MSKVTVIPASINPITKNPILLKKKRRVAAYARVSTDSDEQFTSYEAQIDYYTKYINENPDWELVEIYADEGISGTNTKNRVGFNRMINDALNGKIDLIVTKSVSRFARNTVDSLLTIRKLKEKGVECFFQKENIYTLQGSGELLLTIMSSLAQEESRSISENVIWGQRKAASDGKFHVAYKHFLGYKKGENGRMEVVPEEAKIIRLIYSLFLQGYSYGGIAEYLTSKEIKTPRGKSSWTLSTVKSILKNEKYKGDALLQKTITTDYLTHKTKKNEGEAPQYYIKDSHEAIIEPNEWEMVQAEMKRRETLGCTFSGNGLFANKIVCADCGSFFGKKVWHSNDQYRTEVWQCNHKFKKACKTPHLTEEQIEKHFVEAYNLLGKESETFISDCEFMIDLLDNTQELADSIETCNSEVEIVNELVYKLVKENASSPQDQDEYRRKYEKLNTRYTDLVNKIKDLETELARKKAQRNTLMAYLESYKKGAKIIDSFNPVLWTFMVKELRVTRERTLIFVFFSGKEININLK